MHAVVRMRGHVPLVRRRARYRRVGGHHLGLLGVVAAVHGAVVGEVSGIDSGLLQRRSTGASSGSGTEDIWCRRHGGAAGAGLVGDGWSHS